LAQINSISDINGFGLFDTQSKNKFKGEMKFFDEYLVYLDMYQFTVSEKTNIR